MPDRPAFGGSCGNEIDIGIVLGIEFSESTIDAITVLVLDIKPLDFRDPRFEVRGFLMLEMSIVSFVSG